MDKKEELIAQLQELIRPFLEEIEVELVDLDVQYKQRDIIITILADKPGGGITVEQCSYLNKRITNRIEQENFIDANYSVEVSSPGLDRPLKTKNDFLRVMGREVSVSLMEAKDNKWEFTGKTKAIEGDSIVIECGPENISIPLAQIKKAVQII